MNERHQSNRDYVEVKVSGRQEKISRRNLIKGGLASAALVAGIAWDFNRDKRAPSQSNTPSPAPPSTPEANDSTPPLLEKSE